MVPLPVLDSHAPPVRVMALHALAYCRRLFYLEEVEEIRVADHRVYAGRHLHAALEVAARPEMAGKRVVTIVCDSGERYMSLPFFAP